VRFVSGAATDRGGAPVALTLGGAQAEGDVRLYVRPSRIRLGGEAAALPNRLDATVHFVEFLGDVHRYHLKAGALELFADHAGSLGLSPGQPVTIGWRNEDLQVFRA
jgi:hypothetical protein